ncbi:hypothetical protein AVJ22_02885 [Staphylococcus equorum]|nr:hypothetical protein AVJ22_02885 [Staphylococcus equorum]
MSTKTTTLLAFLYAISAVIALVYRIQLVFSLKESDQSVVIFKPINHSSLVISWTLIKTNTGFILINLKRRVVIISNKIKANVNHIELK